MIVKQLIEELNKLPPNYNIWLENIYGSYTVNPKLIRFDKAELIIIEGSLRID